MLLPADIRAAMELERGSVVTAWLKDGESRMHSHSHGLRTAAARSAVSAGSYASDELITERRAESAREENDSVWLRRRAGRKRPR